jgi:HlyD family secretion protein
MSTAQTLDAPALSASHESDHHGTRRWLPHARAVVIGVLVLLVILFGVRAATAPRPVVPQFRTVKLDHGALAAKVTANGTLSALVTVSVGSQVSGRIDSLGADYGSHVRKGQVVATIEPALFRAAAAQAEANHRAALAAVERANAQVVNARRQFERAQMLRAEGLMTGSDFDTTEAALGVARAEVRVAEANAQQAMATRDQSLLNLHYTTIVSPIEGIVISRNVDVGQTVAATLQAPTLFTIAQDLTRMQVDTNVSESDVGKIREGMAVSFSVDSYPGRSFAGQVRQLRDNAQTIQNVVTYDAVVDVDNSERLLKPGMTANVSFIYAERQNVVRIPNAALRFQPDAATLALLHVEVPPVAAGDARVVWLLRAGHATPVSVRIGISDGTLTELVSGSATETDVAAVELAGDSPNHTP